VTSYLRNKEAKSSAEKKIVAETSESLVDDHREEREQEHKTKGIVQLEQQNNQSEAMEEIFKILNLVLKFDLRDNPNENISPIQDKAQKGLNFVTLGNLLEDEKIEIIQTGFQLQAEGKISLKKYYEGTEKYSLFQSKKYKIKYESVRRTKLYQQLKL
jgi:hypothetical protein